LNTVSPAFLSGISVFLLSFVSLGRVCAMALVHLRQGGVFCVCLFPLGHFSYSTGWFQKKQGKNND
jgi:hypothetical protein